MDKVLRPERFDADPNEASSTKRWQHWQTTFENFLETIEGDNLNKLNVLINFLSAEVYEFISKAQSYEDARNTLKSIYVKTPNEVFARYQLYTRQQKSGESLEEFMQSLKVLSKDCNFQAVSANEYKNEAIRDSFINGLLDSKIRKRLLENQTLGLQAAFDQARALDQAQRHSEYYTNTGAAQPHSYAAAVSEITTKSLNTNSNESPSSSAAISEKNKKCFFCGYNYHTRIKCPAKDSVCHNCEKIGHFSRICRSKSKTKEKSQINSAALNLRVINRAAITPSAAARSLTKSCIETKLNGFSADALVDSGSTDSFVHPSVVEKCGLVVQSSKETVSLAASSRKALIQGFCCTAPSVDDRVYPDAKLYVLSDLCTDVILGQDWQSRHENVMIQWGGKEKAL